MQKALWVCPFWATVETWRIPAARCKTETLVFQVNMLIIVFPHNPPKPYVCFISKGSCLNKVGLAPFFNGGVSRLTKAATVSQFVPLSCTSTPFSIYLPLTPGFPQLPILPQRCFRSRLSWVTSWTALVWCERLLRAPTRFCFAA